MYSFENLAAGTITIPATMNSTIMPFVQSACKWRCRNMLTAIDYSCDTSRWLFSWANLHTIWIADYWWSICWHYFQVTFKLLVRSDCDWMQISNMINYRFTDNKYAGYFTIWLNAIETTLGKIWNIGIEVMPTIRIYQSNDIILFLL